jgi:putative aldouronate transport system substrate-binding protein
MKKLVALLLAALMLSAMSFALAEDKVTITAFQYELPNQEIDFANLWYFKKIEELTNVHVEFQEVKEADFNTQVGLMFASGDYSDVIIRGTVDIEEYGVTQKILIPLDAYLEKDMPNYFSRLGMNNAGASIPASDGQSYYVGYLVAQNVNHNPTWYINKTWLDKLGLAVPTTVDELTAVLKAFKTSDPNGNGLADEIPFSGSTYSAGVPTENFVTQFSLFGVPYNINYVNINKGDKVGFLSDLPGFRAALEWMHSLYADGLMDPECFTQDSNLWASKVNANQVGYMTYLRLKNTALTNPDTIQNWVSILPPASPDYGAAVSAILEVPEQGARLTVANEHVDETLKWLDAQLETTMMLTAINGPLDDKGPIPQTMKLNDAGKYEVISVPENNGLYQIVPVTCGQFFAPGDYYTPIYNMPPHRLERYKDSQTYLAAGVLEGKSFEFLSKLSIPKISGDIATERANLFTELDKFMQESITNFIINGVTDASYTEFTGNLMNLKVDRYVEIYQNAYDAYLANN